MKAKPWQWGILGTGNIARQFAAGVSASQFGRILAVGSRSGQSAKAFAAQFGAARAYDSYEALVNDPDVQAVYISLPNSLHHPWTLKALAAGKHVLCEKPMAMDVKQAREMFDAAHDAQKLLVEAFMYRTHPLTHAVLRQVRQGTIGQLRLIRASFCYQTANLQNIRFARPLGGGGLMDVGCYCIDFARLITGQEPVDVKASAVICETGVDDLFCGQMVFPDGVLASFTCGMRVQADNMASICGQGGYLEVPIPWKPPVTSAEYRLGYSTPPAMDGPGQAAIPPKETFTLNAPAPLYAMEADAFIKAAMGQAEPAVSEYDSLANMTILDEMRRQIDLKW